MPTEYGHGKVCYLEIPARDVEASAAFYRDVFGWTIRRRDNGEVSFDDGVGQVSGAWVTGRDALPDSSPGARKGGILVHIMVDDAEATVIKLQQHGAEITQGIGAHHPEITAQFRDPAGNVLGIYQHRG